ncbi:Txe/YoeB family addiction module toxin [Dolichospermum sp. LEGE 00246]|uniref:Txe/YoeB family addiction module toxin n=1 Tax=Dolichospermum sp. LEGE 00246 TaxID=1828605 RepID=UPI00187E2E25|nr:Txe/YoeB family addiction module toxin [Dolichospermum sp. LEGE 00246]MBE9257394.1 Txe/YoeB family addiction module toxin [Dolichospermum sp. LEGE 00246]
MPKQKYRHLTARPLEAVETVYIPPLQDINSNSDVIVPSPYSSCLHESTTAVTNQSKASEDKQSEYQLFFTKLFKEDMKYWKKHCPAKYKRIQELMQEIQGTPFEIAGKGNPEILKNEYYQGYKKRSRQINGQHRLVYAVSKNTIYFLQARFHYTK